MREPLFLPLIIFASIPLLISSSNGDQLSDFLTLSRFLHTIDPKNMLKIERNKILFHPCSYKWKGIITCNSDETSIIGIRLVNMSLTGVLDADSLCKLPDLKILDLSTNGIRGIIPDTICRCGRLIYLNLSSNGLSGRVPLSLFKIKSLKKLDLSDNNFEGFAKTYRPRISRDVLKKSRVLSEDFYHEGIGQAMTKASPDAGHKKSYKRWEFWVFLVLGIVFLFLVIMFLKMNCCRRAKETEILKRVSHSPGKSFPTEGVEEAIMRSEEKRSELVFFVGEEEWFELDELLEGEADLRTHGFCTSLYVVQLKNDAVFAVKRLKKLKVCFEEFGMTMRRIGSLKHPNILPLVCYSSTHDEKLLVYRYQRNGSLLNLLQNYVEGKREFPWKLRLSIAVGIARGLDYIYRTSEDGREIIPHGSLKLSNIMLDDNNNEPLISEYGYTKFLDPSMGCLFSNGYAAPEKTLTERADVYSFGVILLEMLTGKLVEKSGLDRPRWVRAKVREEWTGEVFDQEFARVEMYAFSLLNVALKCVASRPEERPNAAEVLEKIEEIMIASQDDASPQSVERSSSISPVKIGHS